MPETLVVSGRAQEMLNECGRGDEQQEDIVRIYIHLFFSYAFSQIIKSCCYTTTTTTIPTYFYHIALCAGWLECKSLYQFSSLMACVCLLDAAEKTQYVFSGITREKNHFKSLCLYKHIHIVIFKRTMPYHTTCWMENIQEVDFDCAIPCRDCFTFSGKNTPH